MKILYGIFGSFFAVMLLVAGSTTITSCKKTITIHDTTVVRDTTIVRDTVCDCESGMVAKYTFRNGTLLDSTQYNNNITFNNATPTADRRGVANNAYLFNGTSSYMVVPNSPSLNPTNITLFAVVKVNGFYTGQCKGSNILSKGTPDDVNGFYYLRIADTVNNCAVPFDATRMIFTAQFGNNIPQGTAPGSGSKDVVQTGRWYAIAFSYDGRYARFYVDGQMVRMFEPGYKPFTANGNSIFIGKHDSALFPYFFNGIIDELRIYNHALCDDGIKTLSKL
ncbi:MAG TPA: LamG domain-containing protein [Chitinophagaceae bacterium]|nr:LamG domain-containing protein [Chitinophagaceae bacterium]